MLDMDLNFEYEDSHEQFVNPSMVWTEYQVHQHQEQLMYPKLPTTNSCFPHLSFGPMPQFPPFGDHVLEDNCHHITSVAVGYDDYLSNNKAQSPCPELDEYRRGNSPTFSTSDSSTVGHDESSMFANYTDCGSPTMSQPDIHYSEFEPFALQSPIECGGGGGHNPINPKQIQYIPDLAADDADHQASLVDLKANLEPEEDGIKLHSDTEDSGVVGIPDAVSEHPPSDREDGDYRPAKRQYNGRKRSASNSSHGSATRMPKTARRTGASPGASPKAAAARQSVDSKQALPRSFRCPMANYGCTSAFTSKNEWKRHVSTKHTKLLYWRCDLCPTTVTNGSEYYNDFNRKDLFTQHLRRMHYSNGVDENTLLQAQDRCIQQLRSPPPKSKCLFCDKKFVGSGSWDERLEHVASHMAKDAKIGAKTAQWRDDPDLEKYYQDEGLIQFKDKRWSIGSGVRNVEDEADMDADGEDDEHSDSN